MPARSRARKRALDILYEAELRGTTPDTVLQERLAAADPPVAPYAVDLIHGVTSKRDRIDALLTEHAVGWTIDRMPPVDRNILRLGAYELLYADDIPDPVAISEAIHLARDLSTDESPTFINGLLSRLQELKPTLVD